MAERIVLDPTLQTPEAYLAALDRCTAALESGGVVAVPTDTVWGIGALPDRPAAIERIYEAKGRDPAMPIACLVGGVDQARSLAAVWPDRADELARKHWPGAL